MIENSVATVENAITVGNHTLPIKKYNNVRVVTFKDIDIVHERPDGTARKRFNDNKKYFIEGEDFYKISPSEFRTAIGDMNRRQQNDVTLWCGDCLELMKDIPDKSIDCVITDLPYGSTSCSWDIIIPFDNMWKQLKRITKPTSPIILFGQEPFTSELRISNLKDYKYDIYWEKERLTNIQQVKRRIGKTVETISIFYEKQPTYNPQMIKYKEKPRSNKVKNGVIGKLLDNKEHKVTEYIDTGWRYPTQVWKFQRDCFKSNLHPTQKPIALLEELIKTFSNENDTILDFTMGSGSTGIACKNLNRKFIGIELDEGYFNIAKERIENTNV